MSLPYQNNDKQLRIDLCACTDLMTFFFIIIIKRKENETIHLHCADLRFEAAAAAQE